MVPLFKPHMPAQLPGLDAILRSGSLGYGRWGRAFEAALQASIGGSHVVAVNSYGAAMSVAVLAIGFEPGDEVIASPMTCLASSQPLAAHGLNIVWADIDPATGTLDPDDVARKVSGRTKAIFHNHHCGYVGYVDEINTIGRSYGIVVVDDAIEAFGAEYKGRRIGNLGTDITVFSFQTVRLPCTVDGGALAFERRDLFEKACRARDYGIDRSRFRDGLDEIDGRYDIDMPGIGATIAEPNSYIGCQQLNDVDRLLAAQRRTASEWPNWLRRHGLDAAVLEPARGVVPSYWVFGLLADDKVRLIRAVRERGYYASGVHVNNNRYSVFGGRDAVLPGVEAFQSRFVAVPSGWWVGSLVNHFRTDGGDDGDPSPAHDEYQRRR
jgi:dTDP-4-amino-4,6-dideoxygalactose transaminase